MPREPSSSAFTVTFAYIVTFALGFNILVTHSMGFARSLHDAQLVDSVLVSARPHLDDLRLYSRCRSTLVLSAAIHARPHRAELVTTVTTSPPAPQRSAPANIVVICARPHTSRGLLGDLRSSTRRRSEPVWNC